MKDYKLELNSLGFFIAELTKMITTNDGKAWRVTVKGWRESRSLSQNALQHVIYADLSRYLILKGRKEWTEKKAKFEMKSNFLGWENTECINVHTGEVIVKETLRSTSGLDVGDAFHYTTQVIEFARHVGCEIRIPAKCEYNDLIKQQDQ